MITAKDAIRTPGLEPEGYSILGRTPGGGGIAGADELLDIMENVLANAHQVSTDMK